MAPTILLVEDDEALRYAMAAHLKRAGFAVIAVAGALAALQELDNNAVHLVVADVHLPGGGPHGLSLANVAKHRFDVPAIFMTGDRQLLDATGELPGKLLYKPVDPADLTAEIVRQLSERAASMDGSAELIRRWRMKAEELRTTGEGYTNNAARRNLLSAAETYDVLATNAETRSQRQTDREPEAG